MNAVVLVVPGIAWVFRQDPGVYLVVIGLLGLCWHAVVLSINAVAAWFNYRAAKLNFAAAKGNAAKRSDTTGSNDRTGSGGWVFDEPRGPSLGRPSEGEDT